MSGKGIGISIRRLIAHASASVACGGGGGVPEAPPGTPLLWFKADGSLWSDNGVTPITNATDVYRWDDDGSAAVNLLQVAAANRPTYYSNFASSGKAAVDFVAADNNYMTVAGEPTMTGAVTVLAAVYLDATGGGEIMNVFETNVGTENQIRFAVQAADSFLVFARPYSTDAVGTNAVARSQWVIVAARVNTAGASDTLLYHQGATGSPQTLTLNDDGVHNTGDLWVGRFDSQFFDANLDGALGELIAYGSRLSDADMATALAYLEGKYLA